MLVNPRNDTRTENVAPLHLTLLVNKYFSPWPTSIRGLLSSPNFNRNGLDHLRLQNSSLKLTISTWNSLTTGKFTTFSIPLSSNRTFQTMTCTAVHMNPLVTYNFLPSRNTKIQPRKFLLPP